MSEGEPMDWSSQDGTANGGQQQNQVLPPAQDPDPAHPQKVPGDLGNNSTPTTDSAQSLQGSPSPATALNVQQQNPPDQGGPQVQKMNAQSAQLPNPSEPRDAAKVYLQVDWKEKIPQKWKTHLELALQKWANDTDGPIKFSFEDLHLLEDGTSGKIQITPSSALNSLIKIKTAEVTLKKLNRNTQVHFLVDIPKCANEAQASGSTEDLKTDNRVAQETAGASNSVMEADSKNQALTQSQVPSSAPGEGCGNALTVPLFQFWYMNQAYGKELEQLENDFGVNINAEVSVSVVPKKNTKSNAINDAIQKFIDLFQEASNNMKSVRLSQTQLESDIGKKMQQNIPNVQNRMVLSRSADTCVLFAPANITSMVEKHLNYVQSPNSIEVKMDPQAPLEMDPLHWELMNLACQSQISDMESKYGVTFHAKSVRGSTLVEARSRENIGFNLETPALQDLKTLYQNVAMSAVTCALKDPSEATTVSEMFDSIQQNHPCVVSLERRGGWKLVGLPQHLVPAITQLEELIGRPVFDDKAKQILGFPSNYPQASGSQWGGMRKGTRGRRHDADMKDKLANGDDKKKESDKGKEEDKCPICMDTFTEKTKLDCGHEFCKECLKASEKNLGKICSLCKKVYGTLIGNQPPGTMNVYHKHTNLPGFNRCGTIEITYDIPSGTQTHEHPNPGRYYPGTHRTAYLPNNAEGNQVLRLLQRAFDQRLIFTVGTSRTTGREDSVIWNDIHHKTSTHGGPQSFGYPDPDYLRRVKEELKAKGIE